MFHLSATLTLLKSGGLCPPYRDAQTIFSTVPLDLNYRQEITLIHCPEQSLSLMIIKFQVTTLKFDTGLPTRKTSKNKNEHEQWVEIVFKKEDSLLLMSIVLTLRSTVKLGNKERFDKEQIGVKELFPVANCQFTL